MKEKSKFRQLLKWNLSILSSWAIKKHKIKIVVILGIGGSDIVKEILYTVLKEKRNVRRNVADVWWDLSIPLNILGYEDKKRPLINWAGLIISAVVALLKNKSNPQVLIINADTGNKSTVDYWSKFIHPHYLVLLNYDENSLLSNRLIMQTSTTGGKIIVHENSSEKILAKNEIEKNNIFTFGSRMSELKLKFLTDGRLKVMFKKEKIILPRKIWLSVSQNISGALFSVAVLEGISLRNIAFSFLKYSFPRSMISKIKTNLLSASSNV